MREGWERTFLREVVTLHYGKPMRDVDRVAGDVPVVGSAGVFGWHNEPNVRTSSSIIVGRKGTAGSVTWFDRPVWATDTSYWVEPKIESSLEFIYLLLQNADLPGMTAQTGVPGLNRDRAYSAPVLLPPLEEQQRIVDLIGSLDDAIEAADDAAGTARLAAAELRTELLSGAIRLDGFEGDLETVRLDEIAEVIMGQSPPGSSYNKSGHGIPFIQGSAEFGKRHPSPVQWCNDPRKIALPGDLLVSVRAPVGDMNIASQEIAIGRGLSILRSLAGVDQAYLALAVENAAGQMESVSAGSTFASITKASLCSIAVLRHSADEQNAIVNVIVPLKEAAEEATELAACLRATRAELLTALLSGEHEIPESYKVDISDLVAA